MFRLLLQLVGLGVFFFLCGLPFKGATPAMGGPLVETYHMVSADAVIIDTSEPRELTVLRKKEEIMRRHFQTLRSEKEELEAERDVIDRLLSRTSSRRSRETVDLLEERLLEITEIDRDIQRAQRNLLSIKKDRMKYEEYIRDAERQLASRTRSYDVPEVAELIIPSEIAWPILPERGISASFMEESYAKRFNMEHYAIDLPALQGSEVYAAADGIVLEVNDNGYGYNTLVIGHANRITTVYGHVTEFHVIEGARVFQGDLVARSGGRPGSKGAGFLTTGSHLHFEVHVNGAPIDPLFYLPEMEVVLEAENIVMKEM